MTQEELIAIFRRDTDDLVAPYLSSDASIIQWLAEAEQEAAIRARLIHDVSTAAVCRINVISPTSTYNLHPAIIEMSRAAFTPAGSTTETELYLTDTVEQDRMFPGWRTTIDTPRQAIQTDTQLRLCCIPGNDGVIALEAYRLPLSDPDDSWEPEIAAIHHRHLVLWALYRCYSRPDEELFNQKKSDVALLDFTRVFGLRPETNMRRDSQANRPLFNKAVW
jgi:hypothetical protein